MIKATYCRYSKTQFFGATAASIIPVKGLIVHRATPLTATILEGPIVMMTLVIDDGL
jgi:hypothetical protein